MKAIYITIGTIAFIFFTIHLSAQQIFTDSGQRLGNSCSWDVKLGDLDDDGDLDAVVNNYDWNAGSIQKNEIWLNNGDATFSKSSQELGSGGDITLFDINSDEHLDIFFATSLNISTWINDGAANFTLSDKYLFKGTKIIFDKNINNNNQYEAITSEIKDSNTLLRIYSLNQTTVEIKDSFTITNFNLFFDLSGITMGDLNNDGYSDMVLCQNNGPTFILFNDQKGSFTISNQKLGNGVEPNIYLGDLNGDGFLDLLQCNYHDNNGNLPAHLYNNDGTGKFTEAALLYNSSYITPSATILDLDNDGDIDIYLNHGHRASSLSHKSEILFNDGKGNFTSNTVNLDLVSSTSIAFGDLDNDGDLDAFLANVKINASGSPIGDPNRVWLNSTIGNQSSIKSANDGEFSIYPNPVTGQFTIMPGKISSGEKIVEIYNAEGKLLLTKIFYNTASAVVDLAGFPSGMYVVKVIADGNCHKEKVVKK